VPPAAREKAARLQLLAIGRGPEFAGVMDGYLRFLEALAAGRRRGRLERLLNRAEESLGALEATRMENGLGLGTAEPTR
jgi:hypothetical protein